MSAKEKTNRARHESRRALAKLIKAGRKDPSLYGRIGNKMQRLDREHATYFRQDVAVWLHEDEQMRVEPRLGAGLLLIRAGEKEIESR